MKNIMLSLLFLGVLISVRAQQSEPLHIYFVPRVADAMTPENMNDDSLWEKVPDSRSFVLNAPKGNRLYLKTVFRAVYTGTHLMVRVEAEEPQVDKIDFNRSPALRDDTSGVFKTGHVEFFLDPGLRRKSVGQVVANIDGGIYDAIVCGGNKDWFYAGVTVRSRKLAGGWRLYVAFPFKDPGTDVFNVFSMYPHITPLVGFDACRSRSACGQKATQWSKTPDYSYDRPAKYGVLVMAGEKKAIPALQSFLNQGTPSGITLEGAVRNADGIYRLAITQALHAGERNVRMLPEPRRSQIRAEFKQIRKDLADRADSARLDAHLQRLGALGVEISTYQTKACKELLDAI